MPTRASIRVDVPCFQPSSYSPRKLPRERCPLKWSGFTCPVSRPELPGVFADQAIFSKQGSTPTPWARGLRDQIQKWALQAETFISRVFCAQRGIETMVSDHGLGRGPTMGRGRSGDCHISSTVLHGNALWLRNLLQDKISGPMGPTPGWILAPL